MSNLSYDVEYRGRWTIDDQWTSTGHGPMPRERADAYARGAAKAEGKDFVYRVVPFLTDAQRVAELAAEMHHAIATSADRELADGAGPVYLLSLSTLGTLLSVAYPETDIELVYGAWLDMGETVRAAVEAVEADPESAGWHRETHITTAMRSARVL